MRISSLAHVSVSGANAQKSWNQLQTKAAAAAADPCSAAAEAEQSSDQPAGAPKCQRSINRSGAGRFEDLLVGRSCSVICISSRPPTTGALGSVGQQNHQLGVNQTSKWSLVFWSTWVSCLPLRSVRGSVSLSSSDLERFSSDPEQVLLVLL